MDLADRTGHTVQTQISLLWASPVGVTVSVLWALVHAYASSFNILGYLQLLVLFFSLSFENKKKQVKSKLQVYWLYILDVFEL